MSPIKVVNRVDPLSSLDHMPRPVDEQPSAVGRKRVEEIQKFHKPVTARIGNSNASYQAQANKHMKRVVFQPRDLIWIHLRKQCFLSKRKSRFMPRANGHFVVL